MIIHFRIKLIIPTLDELENNLDFNPLDYYISSFEELQITYVEPLFLLINYQQFSLNTLLCDIDSNTNSSIFTNDKIIQKAIFHN